MKIGDKEIKNANHAARVLILHALKEIAQDAHSYIFGGLDIRSEIARKVIKDSEGIDIASELEAELLLRNIEFEFAKILGSLETKTGILTHMVARNSSGYVDKNAYFKGAIK